MVDERRQMAAIDEFPLEPGAARGKKKRSDWFIVALALLAAAALFLVAIVGTLAYAVAVGPDTTVYNGSQVPRKFLDTMEEVGAIEPGEKLLYFYSDGFFDILSGFYFVSNRRFVMYASSLDPPLFSVGYDAILDVEMERDTSFYSDSQVTLHLEDGDTIWFPLSGENNRDEVFLKAITDRIGQ